MPLESGSGQREMVDVVLEFASRCRLVERSTAAARLAGLLEVSHRDPASVARIRSWKGSDPDTFWPAAFHHSGKR